MKNILVPTNFSENCEKAAQLGIEMAKLYNSEIHFLHLMKTPVDWVKLDKEKEKRYYIYISYGLSLPMILVVFDDFLQVTLR